MTYEEAISKISEMDIYTLIDIINDDIDNNFFKYSGIFEIDDEDGWEKITKHCGGYLIYKAVRSITNDYNPEYFFYDEDSKTITFFTTKEEILEFVGIDNLADNMTNE